MDEFAINLMRAAVAYVQVQCQLAGAREMFGKSFFSLGQQEQQAVNQAVLNMGIANYHSLTRENLAPKPDATQGAGFLAGITLGPNTTPGSGSPAQSSGHSEGN